MGFHDKWRTRWGFMINEGQGGYFMINGGQGGFHDKWRTRWGFMINGGQGGVL